MSTCRSTKRVDGLTFSCTRERGHHGIHKAHNVVGIVVRVWKAAA